MCYINKDALPCLKRHIKVTIVLLLIQNTETVKKNKQLQLNIFPELSVKVLKGRTKLNSCQRCAFAYFIWIHICSHNKCSKNLKTIFIMFIYNIQKERDYIG